MPAPRHQFSASDREILHRALHRVLGIRLDGKAACIKAAEVLKARTPLAPSATTLYQLMVGAEQGRRPYKATLDALAAALGHRDWQEMRVAAAGPQAEPGLRMDQVFALPALFATCLRKGCHEVVDEFLDQWRDRIDHVSIFDVGLAIYAVLYREPALERPFYERYAAHPVVRRAFFELMADPYFQLAHADEGLGEYLKASPTANWEQGYQDRLFAGSMLFRHHYITGDPRLIEQGRRLYGQGVDLAAISATHLFPATRFLTYALWYDVFQRRTNRRRQREGMVVEWAAERLLQERSALERDIIFHTLVEGLEQVNLLDRLLPELLRLFPDVDPDALADHRRRAQLLAAREPNGLRVHFKRIVSADGLAGQGT